MCDQQTVAVSSISLNRQNNMQTAGQGIAGPPVGRRWTTSRRRGRMGAQNGESPAPRRTCQNT